MYRFAPGLQYRAMAQRILVVDDDRQIVRLVQTYLEQAGFRVSAAFDGEQALHAIRRDKPDLVVLDLMLPGKDGLEVTRVVRGDAALAGTAILMLTARVDDTDKIVGLELGADDYLAKPFNPREVVARARAVLRRAAGAPAAPRRVEHGRLAMDLERHEVTLGGRPVDLTPTEYDVLKLLMSHPGRAFSRDQIIEQALGYAYTGMDRTVDSHIKNLRRKLDADAGAEQTTWIETVYGVGYRLREE